MRLLGSCQSYDAHGRFTAGSIGLSLVFPPERGIISHTARSVDFGLVATRWLYRRQSLGCAVGAYPLMLYFIPYWHRRGYSSLGPSVGLKSLLSIGEDFPPLLSICLSAVTRLFGGSLAAWGSRWPPFIYRGLGGGPCYSVAMVGHLSLYAVGRDKSTDRGGLGLCFPLCVSIIAPLGAIVKTFFNFFC